MHYRPRPHAPLIVIWKSHDFHQPISKSCDSSYSGCYAEYFHISVLVHHRELFISKGAEAGTKTLANVLHNEDLL